MPQHLLAIVADDLTGLQAVASEFSKQGLGVQLCLEPEALSFSSGAEVLGIDTNSRQLSTEAAADAVRRVVTRLRAAGVRYVYKQADSGMQGPLAAEIEAAVQGLGAPGVVFAPSCPVLGRVMRGARQRDGAGLDVDVRELWRAQTGNVPASCKAQNWAAERQVRPPLVWLADAESDAELLALAEAVWPQHDSATPCLLAGSVGLAAAVATVWRRRSAGPHVRPVLVIAGSQQAQTKRQTEALGTATGAVMVSLPDQLLSASEAQQWVDQVRAALHAGRHVVAAAQPSGSAAAPSEGGYPLIAAAARDTLEHNLRRTLLRLLPEGEPWPIAGLLIAGGATAELVARDVLRVRQLALRIWLAPGVAGALAVLPGDRLLPLVTKAGTWGDAQVLARAVDWIGSQTAGLATAGAINGRTS